MSETKSSNDSDDSDDSNDSNDGVEQGVKALLIGALLLQNNVMAGRSARITMPIGNDLRRLLEMTSGRAVAEAPDLVQELVEVRKYLEQSLRLIDGGFHRSLVNTQMQNMIALLEDLL